MGSFNNSNLDNLLLETLMGRLQIRPPATNPLLLQTLEDLLGDQLDLTPSSDDDDNKPQLASEESKIEKKIIRIIQSGKSDTLMPNSGQAVSIRDHPICVGFHEEEGSDYRVWEWHGHIMLFDDDHGYAPEYIYGNYFERLKIGPGGGIAMSELKDDDDEEEKVSNLGLKELIVDGDAVSGRIVHRNVNATSSRFF